MRHEVTGKGYTKEQREKAIELLKDLEDQIAALVRKFGVDSGIPMVHAMVMIQEVPPWNTGGEMLGYVLSSVADKGGVDQVLSVGLDMLHTEEGEIRELITPGGKAN